MIVSYLNYVLDEYLSYLSNDHEITIVFPAESLSNFDVERSSAPSMFFVLHAIGLSRAT